jgi:hypothetical protein
MAGVDDLERELGNLRRLATRAAEPTPGWSTADLTR